MDSLAQQNWKTALIMVRTQIADYEREGTSTPGKLKRAARLRTARMCLRDAGATMPTETAAVKAALADIEKAEKDDNWRRLAELIPATLAQLDGFLGADTH